jgi:hypothetical protein
MRLHRCGPWSNADHTRGRGPNYGELSLLWPPTFSTRTIGDQIA